MERIETVGIVGMGALGLLYADLITRGLGEGHVFFIADRETSAIRKAISEIRYCNTFLSRLSEGH